MHSTVSVAAAYRPAIRTGPTACAPPVPLVGAGGMGGAREALARVWTTGRSGAGGRPGGAGGGGAGLPPRAAGRGPAPGVSVRVPLVRRVHLDLGRVWSAACPPVRA